MYFPHFQTTNYFTSSKDPTDPRFKRFQTHTIIGIHLIGHSCSSTVADWSASCSDTRPLDQSLLHLAMLVDCEVKPSNLIPEIHTGLISSQSCTWKEGIIHCWGLALWPCQWPIWKPTTRFIWCTVYHSVTFVSACHNAPAAAVKKYVGHDCHWISFNKCEVCESLMVLNCFLK